MNKQIKLLLIAFGLCALAGVANATCNECDQNPPPASCNPPPPPPPGDSMPEGVVIDDMSTAIFADEVALPASTTFVASSATE